jgi:homoserine dehydrogenase
VSSVKIALLGCGTVGSVVARALTEPSRAAALERAVGASLELVGVAVADPSAPREGVAPGLVTGDALGLLTRASPDVVVELIGGTGHAGELVTAAIEGGASVVTANKALLAGRLRVLTSLAEARGVDLLYEAAVAGAIPVLRVLRTSLAGERLTSVLGIVNGTTNYVLTTMSRGGRDYGRSRLRRGPRRGDRPGLRGARPHRRRRGARRRAEGRDPRHARLRPGGHRRRRPPRGYLAHHRRRPRGRGADGPRRPAARRR